MSKEEIYKQQTAYTLTELGSTEIPNNPNIQSPTVLGCYGVKKGCTYPNCDCQQSKYQDRQRYAELNAIHQPTIDLLKEYHKEYPEAGEVLITIIRNAIELKLKEKE